MEIKNLKLFTEYESQMKRKFPGCFISLVYKNNEMVLTFNVPVNGHAYEMTMRAPEDAKNGDVKIIVRYERQDKTYTECEFSESRKPMEMNISNLFHACNALINKETV